MNWFQKEEIVLVRDQKKTIFDKKTEEVFMVHEAAAGSYKKHSEYSFDNHKKNLNIFEELN